MHNQHYDTIATTYHQSWFYTHESAYERWMLNHIIRYALFSKHHTFCDLGGGTGRFAHLIHQTIGFEHPVICVDSSSQMLTCTQNVIPVCKTMEDYVSHSPQRFDRILIKEAIHHVSGVCDFFKSLYHCLQPDGKVILVTRPQHISYPIPEKARSIWADTQPSVSVYTNTLRESGMSSVNVYTHEFPIKLSKTEWLKMIQARIWSVFSEEYFTDEELTNAIQEIGKTHGETIQFTDRLIFIVGSR